jgi:hypothetical protein
LGSLLGSLLLLSELKLSISHDKVFIALKLLGGYLWGLLSGLITNLYFKKHTGIFEKHKNKDSLNFIGLGFILGGSFPFIISVVLLYLET